MANVNESATPRFSSGLFVALNEQAEPPDRLVDAVEFARAADISLTLFDAVAPASRIQQHIRLGGKQVAGSDFASRIRREQLQRWADEHRQRLHMGVTVATGRRSVAAAQRAASSGHNLIIVAPDGSEDDLAVARRVVRAAPCAVLVLRQSILSGPVIVAMDPDDDPTLNATAAVSASRIATIHQRGLHVVHAYEPHGLHLLRLSDTDRFTPADIDAFADDARAAHRQAVEQLVDDLGLSGDVEIHVDVGAPLEVIARTIVETDASLVTIGAGGRPRSPAVLIGSTADRVIGRTSASVLVVKRPGLVAADDTDDSAWSRSVGGPTAIVTPAIAPSL